MSKKKQKQTLTKSKVKKVDVPLREENSDESRKKRYLGLAGKLTVLLLAIVAIVAVGFWWQGLNFVKEKPLEKMATGEISEQPAIAETVPAAEVITRIAAANHWSGANQNKVRLTWQHEGEHFRHTVSMNVNSFFRDGVSNAQIQASELAAIEKVLSDSGFLLAPEYLHVVDEGRGFEIKIYSNGVHLFGVGEKSDPVQGDSLCVLSLGKVTDWQTREQTQIQRWQRSELAEVLESVADEWVVLTDKTDVSWQSTASARVAYGLRDVESSGGVYILGSQELQTPVLTTLQQQLAGHGWAFDQERAWLDDNCDQNWQTSWYTNGKEVAAVRVGEKNGKPVIRVEVVATLSQLVQAEADEKDASALLAKVGNVASGRLTILQARQMRTVGDLSRYLVHYSQGCERHFAYFAMTGDEKTLIYSGLETLGAEECARLSASDQMLREDSDFLVGQFCHQDK